MTSAVRVIIATTVGPIAIERLASFPGRKSKAFKWGSLEPFPALSSSYNEFVHKRVSRIPRCELASASRIDLSGEIDTGESWQLAVFIAHALQSVERLSTRGEKNAAATILVATGKVDHDLSVSEVGFVEEKLKKLLEDNNLRQAMAVGRRVIFAMPEANRANGILDQEAILNAGAEVVPIGDVRDLLRQLDLRLLLRGPDPDDTWDGSPFRGLEVFDTWHRQIFCGRGKAREEALQKLRRLDLAGCSFLLIHGPSGVGKSSLARAGLLGDLEQTASANDRWRTAVILPSRGKVSPLLGLADALVSAVPEIGCKASVLHDQMLADPAKAALEVTRGLVEAGANGRLRLALLVDQLEELLLRIREEPTRAAVDEREAFAGMLERLARTRLVWVIATLRSDLLPLLGDSVILSELAKDDRLYRLDPPSPGALSEIVRRPAELAGVRFIGHDEDNLPLVEVLSRAAEGQRDCLPLLQFILKLLYDQDCDRTGKITYEMYRSIGGLENAIGKWADKTVHALGDEPEIDHAVDDLIFNLGRRDSETKTVVAAELLVDEGFSTSARDQVIERLAEARLVVVDTADEGGQRIVRVTHEALLTHWPRAHTLFETYAAKLALKENLEHSAHRWQDQKEDKAFLILGEGPLAEAKLLSQDRHVVLSALARRYIAASVAEHDITVEFVNQRLARDEQKIADLLKGGEFQAAASELERVTLYLAGQADRDLQARQEKEEARLTRIRRLAGFVDAAREADSLAGEEEFDAALPKCEEALEHVGLRHRDWLARLPIHDLADYPDHIADLEQEIYRTLILYSALQLVPGIRALGSESPVSARQRIDLKALLRPVLPYLLSPPIGPLLLPIVARNGGIPLLFRLPARLDRERAYSLFRNIHETLAKIREMEARFTKHNGDGDLVFSRSNQFIHRIVDFLMELSSSPKGQAIDYHRWLLGGWSGPSPQPINAADHFFIGLLNYFVAKRREAWIPKLLTLLRDQFPDIDATAPLQAANRLLRTAVMLEPRNFWAHWVLGRNLLQSGDHAGAELAFNAAISLRPGYSRGYEQRALAIAHQMTQPGTNNKRLRGWALKDSDSARKYAARTDGGDPSIFWPRGELFELLGNLAEALHSYARWLELEQDIPSLIARSSGLQRLQQLATHLVRPRVRVDAACWQLRAGAWAMRAHVQLIRKNFHEARTDADAALQVAPNQVHALTAKGMILLRLGDSMAALEPLERAVALVSSTHEPNYRALYERAKARQCIAGGVAELAAWQDLAMASIQSRGDRCPTWMLEEAVRRLASMTASAGLTVD
ncbi:MAG TPA: hypothetical protein VMU81_09570 [Acetobacteraceae bacterium]|nr:hypothetical protein [Acetobacteraceae bacterium]